MATIAALALVPNEAQENGLPKLEAQRKAMRHLLRSVPKRGLQVAPVVPLCCTDPLQELPAVRVLGEPSAHVFDHVDLFLVWEPDFLSSRRIGRLTRRARW